MDEIKQNTSAGKNPSDPHIPPPTDPYVTYQTPYPRKPSDEIHNPFIEFRRLADAAFSSFFSGLPKFLGTDKFKEANIRESDQAFVRAFDDQAKEFESRIAEMVRVRAEEAEGFRKKLEQEWEERRRENEKRMEEESQRWDMMRRGLEKCPGLRPEGVDVRREAESELDLYEGLNAYEAAAYKPVSSAEETATQTCPWKDGRLEKNCPWDENESADQGTRRGWLTGLGWDGRRRAKNIPLFIPRVEEEQSSATFDIDWTAYNDADMDPFSHDDHVVPWLKLSPYSPLSLIQGWNNNHNQADGSDLMPWDEAFEDLMAVHKTGKLPNAVRSLVYWGGPNQWMSEMALRGSLGSKWNEGFMVSALMEAVNGRHWRGFNGFSGLCQQLAGRSFRENLPGSLVSRAPEDEEELGNDWTRLSEDNLHSKPRNLFDEIEELAETLFGTRHVPDRALGPRGRPWPTPEEVLTALSEGRYRSQESDSFENHTVDEYEEQTPVPDSWSSSSVQTLSRTSANDQPDSIISTLTTSTSRTLPDGSVETKRVLKKRFADGREENSESTETQAAPVRESHDASASTVPEQTQKQKKQAGTGGWFWN